MGDRAYEADSVATKVPDTFDRPGNGADSSVGRLVRPEVAAGEKGQHDG